MRKQLVGIVASFLTLTAATDEDWRLHGDSRPATLRGFSAFESFSFLALRICGELSESIAARVALFITPRKRRAPRFLRG